MNPRPQKPGILNIWVLIGALLIGTSLLLALYLVVGSSRPPRQPVGVVTAALTVIPVPTATPTQPVLLTPTLDAAIVPTPMDGSIGIGSFVKVTGTGGAGLRLRVEPGLDYDPVYLGMEDEIFKVEAGPQDADSYTWWFLVAPFDSERNGWAVSNYLEPVQEP